MSHHSVKFKGNPVELEGPEIKVGAAAPAFSVLNMDLQPKGLEDWAGKVRIISVVPSLDTPVCDLQSKRFNEEAGKLGSGTVVLTVSVDLPFAQKRWCASTHSDKIQVLSDHRDLSFGRAYGTLIPALRLLARAVFVVGTDNKIYHAEYVSEVTEHPNYDAALAVARKIAG